MTYIDMLFWRLAPTLQLASNWGGKGFPTPAGGEAQKEL